MSSQPPPLPDRAGKPDGPQPVQPLGYHSQAPTDPNQRVFDRVAGPNLRLRDNMIQLFCVVVGGLGGFYASRQFSLPGGAVIGVVCGLLISLIVSGLIIGLIRFFRASRPRSSR